MSSKLPYIVEDIKDYVHVFLGPGRAVLLRVKEVETRRGIKQISHPVFFQQAKPKGGIPFWVEVPRPRLRDGEETAKRINELKLKALTEKHD